ncbi:MAG: hypothetical protein ACLR23_22225 [Clostridia bacterium]
MASGKIVSVKIDDQRYHFFPRELRRRFVPAEDEGEEKPTMNVMTDTITEGDVDAAGVGRRISRDGVEEPMIKTEDCKICYGIRLLHEDGDEFADQENAR